MTTIRRALLGKSADLTCLRRALRLGTQDWMEKINLGATEGEEAERKTAGEQKRATYSTGRKISEKAISRSGRKSASYCPTPY